MKRLFGVLLGLVFATSAFAADLPVKARPFVAPAAWSWTGLYLGLDGGWNLGKFNPLFGAPGDATTVNLDDNSGFIGGNITYLFQPSGGIFVVGVEIGAQYWGFKSKAELLPPVEGTSVLNLQSKIDWLAFGGAQIGITPFDRTLIYVSGGVAWAHIKTEFGGAVIDLADVSVASTQSLNGWYVGGGLAIKITDTIILGGEYRHIDFGTINATNGMLTPPLGGSDKLTVDQAMARLKFKLN